MQRDELQPPAGGTLPPGANVSDGTFVKVPLVEHFVLPLPEYPVSHVTTTVSPVVPVILLTAALSELAILPSGEQDSATQVSVLN